jgi:hypothetical protein
VRATRILITALGTQQNPGAAAIGSEAELVQKGLLNGSSGPDLPQAVPI